MRTDFPRATSLSIIAVIYSATLFWAVFAFRHLLPVMPGIWALLLSDVIATVLVWFFGLVYDNVSVYDPYWSVAPPILFLMWACYKHCWSLPVILLLIAVWYWGIRLTRNWVITFKGLAHEDWRYTRYRRTLSPVLFQLVNFFGLNMMPTLLVFACMLPGLGLYVSEPVNLLTWLGFVMCLSSATIQLIADAQIHRFRDGHPGQFCNVGLWKHGRHPNYFGEVQFWWGIWVMYASLNGIDWLIFAPVAMTCLFLFVSVPMMERRQLANKPGYAEYRKQTRVLI